MKLSLKITYKGDMAVYSLHSKDNAYSFVKGDKTLLSLIAVKFEELRHVMAYYFPTDVDKEMRRLNLWIRAGLRNRLVPETVKTELKKIPTYIAPDAKFFTSELCERISFIHAHLVNVHKFSQRKSLTLIIGMLQDYFPNEQRLEKLTYESMGKAMRPYITRQGK